MAQGNGCLLGKTCGNICFVPLLYKYLDPDGIQALRNMTLLASDPSSFNDPFEVRPAFDQERHDYYAKTHEAFYAEVGVEHSLLENSSMVGLPTENAVDFGDHINQRFIQELSERFRVLCLSRDPQNVLMWGHYTKSKQGLAHSGLILGIDTSAVGFPSGMKTDGYGINYSPDHLRPKIPLAWYRGISVEEYIQGNIVNNPNQPVQSDGGLVIPFSEYRRQVVVASIALLTTKSVDWAYEQEVRFIYDLQEHQNQLRVENKRCFVSLSSVALREVVFGYHTSYELVQEVVQLFKSGHLGNPQLLYAMGLTRIDGHLGEAVRMGLF